MSSADDEHRARAIAIAEKVTIMAEGSLSRLDAVIGEWPGEYRAIMWDAVADIARRRAAKARMNEPAHTPAHSPTP